MLTLQQVKNNPQILEFVRQSETALKKMGYTDHGMRHVNLVADRAASIARKAGLGKRQQELSSIAGFCHDMGNFMGRTQHHYWGALLFQQALSGETDDYEGLAMAMQAIVNHDKESAKIMNAVSAIVILADKSDVHRSRVARKSLKAIRRDIHDRVNYAVTESSLRVRKDSKEIILKLKIDTKIVPVMEYFEIFTERMAYCRQAAEYLGYRFGLEINKFKLL